MSITIGSPTPATTGPIMASASVQFTLTDPGVATFASCLVEIFVAYASGTVELAYSTAYGGWTPTYGQGSVAPPTGLPLPGGFTITRGGGWPADPSLTVQVSDTTGSTARAIWSYQLAQAPISATTALPVPQSQSPYGSDCRTFAPLPDGTLGVDPYFLLTSDANTVMTESIGRILSMPQGALWYALSQGYDLRSLINAQTNGDFTGVQSAVVQAATRDPRIQSCSCLIQQSGPGTYSAQVSGVGGSGPFSCVFLLSSAGITALSYS